MHKSDFTGRPVVISAECRTSKVSKFVEHYLKPHTEALPSHIKDTVDFNKKIQ